MKFKGSRTTIVPAVLFAGRCWGWVGFADVTIVPSLGFVKIHRLARTDSIYYIIDSSHSHLAC